MLASDAIEVVGIYLSDRIRTKTGSFPGDVYRIIQTSGPCYAFYLALGTLVFQLFRRPGARPTIKTIAKSRNIQIFSDKDINSPASLNWLKKLAPDILLSGFFNQKLEAEALSIASRASLNLHPALLPKYKGVDPVFYYFLNNEQALGVTMHQMDSTYDTGRILASHRLAIDSKRSVFWHNIELFKLGVDLFIQWLEEHEEEKTDSLEPPGSLETEYYDSWPTHQQVKQLRTPLFTWKDFIDQASINQF